MGRNRFVVPDVTRLELSDGDWVEVKSRLTYGEQQRLAGGALTSGRASKDGLSALFDVDTERYSILRLQIWLVDWSFCDANGKAVRLSPEAIAALDTDAAAEVTKALDAHIEQLAAEKNLMPPVTATGEGAPKRKSR